MSRARGGVSPRATGATLRAYFDRMLAHFGPRGWWPANSRFEICIGAILTQNTSWTNVERAIANLKRDKLLCPRALVEADPARIEAALRTAGYYRQKTVKLRAFCTWLNAEFGGSVNRMRRVPHAELRPRLLAVHGIGPETADDILLYACDAPVFVVDAYTRRIFSRHGLVAPDVPYEPLRAMFERRLPRDVALWQEYHALIVHTGKDYCRTRPDCARCPLAPLLRRGQPLHVATAQPARAGGPAEKSKRPAPKDRPSNHSRTSD